MLKKPDTKYEQNEIVYCINTNEAVKGIIEEVICHYTQKGRIVKYIIRPYGKTIDACIAVDEKDIVDLLEDAVKVLKVRYETIFKEIFDKLNNLTDEVFDKKEQELKKGE